MSRCLSGMCIWSVVVGLRCSIFFCGGLLLKMLGRIRRVFRAWVVWVERFDCVREVSCYYDYGFCVEGARVVD